MGEKDKLKDEKDKLKDEKDKDQENLQESILGNEDEDAKNDQEDGKEKKLRVRTPTAVMASSWLWLEGRPKGYRPPRNRVKKPFGDKRKERKLAKQKLEEEAAEKARCEKEGIPYVPLEQKSPDK